MKPDSAHQPRLADIEAARRRIAGTVRRTPLIQSEWLSASCGGDVYLKLESLQVTNSFKARGALNVLRALAERHPAGRPLPTVVTASAGNHGRAMAWAAHQIGLPVIVYTPRRAPAAKLDAIRGYGADLRAVAETYEDTERLAKACAAETGVPFVSAYSHPDLLAATGTIGLEIVEDLPGVDQVVVPVGGGGLVAGIAAALTAVRPEAEVVGVEAEASHPFADSLAAGRIVVVEVGPTIADGLAGNMDPDNIAFPVVQALVDRMTMVSEVQLVEGIGGLVRHEHLIAEGAGIAGVAAVLAGRVSTRGRRTVVIVSGANIDSDRLAGLIGA
jgi:threonine dehydratase